MSLGGIEARLMLQCNQINGRKPANEKRRGTSRGAASAWK
jgi:hypothetical protein